MIGKIREGWTWFVEGLVEALLWAVDRSRRVTVYRIDVADDAAVVHAPDGARIGAMLRDGDAARFEPPDVGRRLVGAAVQLVVPAAWQFRRDLDPVAVQSRPFLDAFVRHQIERITPWRAADTHYRILQQPLAGDANRIAVAVAVVPKRLVTRWLAPLEGLHLRSIRLQTAGGPEAEGSAMTLGGDRSRLAVPLRRGVTWGLVACGLAAVFMVAWLQWEAGAVRADIDEQDRVLAERKAVLARTQHHDHADGDAAARLQALRNSRPRAVAVIDALSSAVPDTAYLTSLSIDKDHVTISGLTTDPSGLIPALEASRSFSGVSFGGPTTRLESGSGDRFSLEMKAVPDPLAAAERSGGRDATPPPPLDGATAQARVTP